MVKDTSELKLTDKRDPIVAGGASSLNLLKRWLANPHLVRHDGEPRHIEIILVGG